MPYHNRIFFSKGANGPDKQCQSLSAITPVDLRPRSRYLAGVISLLAPCPQRPAPVLCRVRRFAFFLMLWLATYVAPPTAPCAPRTLDGEVSVDWPFYVVLPDEPSEVWAVTLINALPVPGLSRLKRRPEATRGRRPLFFTRRPLYECCCVHGSTGSSITTQTLPVDSICVYGSIGQCITILAVV